MDADVPVQDGLADGDVALAAAAGVISEGQVASPPPTATETAQVAGFMDLPDELLVNIFNYVEHSDYDWDWHLLELRAVCRRWRDLLVLPDVWRHRFLTDSYHSPDLIAAALAVVPCLERIFLAKDEVLQFGGALAATTKCAARQLGFYASDEEAGIVALIIRNQAALGRLREISLFPLNPAEPVSSDVRVLLRTLCEVEGLTVLNTDDDCWINGEGHNLQVARNTSRLRFPYPASVVPEELAPSSLVEFNCSQWLPDDVVEYLLESHAPTLVDVYVECIRPGCRAPVARLLSQAPHLRQLYCQMMPDMFLMRACALLRSVTLVLPDASDRALLPDARAFLREATQLEDVALVMRGASNDMQDVVPDLVSALAASRCSRVRKIEVTLHDQQRSPNLKPAPAGLARALSGLLQLQRLHLSSCAGVSLDFLEALSHARVPSLRWLHLKVDPLPGGGCQHAWLHSGPVTDFLRRNGLLHLQLSSTWGRFRCKDDTTEVFKCQFCRAACHSSDEDLNRSWRVNVFTHAEGSACGVAHWKIKDEAWLQFDL